MTSNAKMPSTTFDSYRTSLICLVTGGLVFLISLVISSFYNEGDQVAYHNAYEALSGLGIGDNWRDIRIIYASRVTSDEWVHMLVSLAGGGLGIRKNLLMSVINGILAAYTLRLILSWGANLQIAMSLVLANYYFYVIYFAAERLKFAILFLVLSLLCSKRPFWFTLNAIFSIFSHFSVVFIYCGTLLSKIPKTFAKPNHKELLLLGASLASLVLFVFFNSQYLLMKINTYSKASGQISAGQLIVTAILFFLSTLYARNKLEPLLALFPFFVGVATIGGTRTNMLGFFIFFYYGIQTRGGLNVGVITVMLYLSYKTIMFVNAIFTSGQGFGLS